MEKPLNHGEIPTPVNPKYAQLEEFYGKPNMDTLVSLFEAENPDMTMDQLIDALHKEHMSHYPFSTTWPNTSLDDLLIFGCR
jgi:hypothetical protein